MVEDPIANLWQVSNPAPEQSRLSPCIPFSVKEVAIEKGLRSACSSPRAAYSRRHPRKIPSRKSRAALTESTGP